MKIVILGNHVTEYLKNVVFYLAQYNRKCSLGLLDASDQTAKYELKIRNFVSDMVEIECDCIEIDPNKALEQLEKNEKTIKAAENIINVLPVKYFPSLRFNVDQQWEGIENWISPIIYQRMLASMLKKNAKVIWILQGIENINLTNDFFERKENEIVMKDPYFGSNRLTKELLDEIVEQFWNEFGEKDFGSAISNDLVYFGFSSHNTKMINVGEKAMKFWCLYSFSSIYGQDIINL